jgi:hypothetical protein
LCLSVQYQTVFGHSVGNYIVLPIDLVKKWNQDSRVLTPRPTATMPSKVYITFILPPSQEWDQRITSIGPISDRLRPFHRQLYSSTDGSRQIMEPRRNSITQTNNRHALESLYMIHSTSSQEWDPSIVSIGSISS